jgi:hypothetical protein
MKFALAIIAALCLFSTAAQASHKHHGHRFTSVHHHTFVRHHRGHRSPVAVAGLNLVTVETKAGPITVASDLADKFVGFINSLPYTPRHVSCFARGGHVAHSRHYAGAACDVDQTGWGRTAGPMHHITALAAQFGLRDGCSFGDCGHVDDGQVLSGHTYASLRRGHRFGG